MADDTRDHRGRPRVVVTGMGVKTPGGCDLDTFWTNITEARPSAQAISDAVANAGDAAGDTKGLEVDGNEPAPGTNDVPRTPAKMFNFTVIGNLTQLTTPQNSALQFRRGAGVSLYNSVIAGWVMLRC